MKVNIKDNEIFITLNKQVFQDEIVDILEYLKIKEILYKSELTKTQVLELDNDLKNNWWNNNRDKIMEKVNDSY